MIVYHYVKNHWLIGCVPVVGSVGVLWVSILHFCFRCGHVWRLSCPGDPPLSRSQGSKNGDLLEFPTPVHDKIKRALSSVDVQRSTVVSESVVRFLRHEQSVSCWFPCTIFSHPWIDKITKITHASSPPAQAGWACFSSPITTADFSTHHTPRARFGLFSESNTSPRIDRVI